MKDRILFLFVSLASMEANATTSYYVPDFLAADLSAWSPTVGGTLQVPYVLASGTAAGSLGTSFTVPYTVQLSGVSGSGYDIPVASTLFGLSFRPDDVGAQPTIGSQFSASFNIGSPIPAGGAWNLLDQNVLQSFSGFTGSTSNTIAQLQSPYPTIDHGQSATYTWDVSVGGLGLTTFIGGTPRYDSRGVAFSTSPTAPDSRTFIAYRVPEPSRAVLLALACFLGCARRSKS